MTHTLYHGDCLDILPTLPAQSVDAVITDPPFGTTRCKWDSAIPFDAMWPQLKRVIKPNGAIVLFGVKPFSAALVMSNPQGYKHEWIWKKQQGGNFAVTKYMPLSVTESIMVFTANGERANYYPQMRQGKPHGRGNGTNSSGKAGRGFGGLPVLRTISDLYYPQNVLDFYTVPRADSLHESQKPVDLLRYLVRTYSLAGQTILDFTMGSGSTGVAALMEGRQFVGIEKDNHYFTVATDRIEQVQPALMEAAD